MAYNYEWPYTDPEQYNDDWLLTKMKQLAAEWEQMKVKFTTLEEYVKNYFANLNLQDEVNKKIDAMIADGRMSELLRGVSGPLAASGSVCIVVAGREYNHSMTSSDSRLPLSLASNLGYSEVIDLLHDDSGLTAPGSLSYENIIRQYVARNPSKRINSILVFLNSADPASPYFTNAIVSLSSVASSLNCVGFIFPPTVHNHTLTAAERDSYYFHDMTFLPNSVVFGNFYCIIPDLPFYCTVDEWLNDTYRTLTPSGCDVWKSMILSCLGVTVNNKARARFVEHNLSDGGTLAVKIIPLGYRTYILNMEIRTRSTDIRFNFNIPFGSGAVPCYSLSPGASGGQFEMQVNNPGIMRFTCSHLSSRDDLSVFGGNLIVGI